MARELRKKLWLVKREVIATSLKRALQAQGTVYAIELTEEKQWPEFTQAIPGFKHGKKK